MTSRETAIAETIQTLRMRLGLSQQALADQVGVHRSFISALEMMRNVPTPRMMPELAAALSIPWEGYNGRRAYRMEDGSWVATEGDKWVAGTFALRQEALGSQQPSEALLKDVRSLVQEAASIDGGHHKQWYLIEIGRRLGIFWDFEEIEMGVAP